MELKASADAQGITQKAEAMKLFDGVGREHEEFKLRLDKEKQIELFHICNALYGFIRCLQEPMRSCFIAFTVADNLMKLRALCASG